MTKFSLSITALSLAMLGLVGCGSDSESDTGSGSSSTFSCADACQKSEELGCSEPVADCTAACQAQIDDVPSCTDEMSAAFACMTAQPMVCGEDGHAVVDDTQADGACVAEALAILKCGACEAGASDTACDTCMKTACCDATLKFVNDPNLEALFKCNADCKGDQACESTCAQNGGASILENTLGLIACQSEKCSDVCAQQ